MTIRVVAVSCVVVILAAACASSSSPSETSADSSTTSTAPEARPSRLGPFVVDDPGGVIVEAAWVEPAGPALSRPIPDDGPEAVLMETSEPDVLRIAVNGGGCVPETTISVVGGPPALELRIELSEGIPDAGLQCTALLTTHAFEVYLSEPVVLADVIINGLPVTIGAAETPARDASGELRVIVLPDADGRMPPDVVIGCPSGPAFPASALDKIRPFSGSDLPDVEAAIRVFLDDEEGQYWPQDNWQILHQTDTIFLLVHLDQSNGSLAFIGVELVNSEWKWAGASGTGECPLRVMLPQELGVVDWRIDPSAGPLTPESTTIEVLVTERGCASGQAIGERLLAPEILMTETAVLLAFAATPSPGAQTCPGNPEQALTVELPEPVGDRSVADGLDIGTDLQDALG